MSDFSEEGARPARPRRQERPEFFLTDFHRINGLSGYYDPEQRRFWISKSMPEDGMLSERVFEEIAALRDNDAPVIEEVDVLFNLQSLAVRHRERLAAVGAFAWFCDRDTGRLVEL